MGVMRAASLSSILLLSGCMAQTCNRLARQLAGAADPVIENIGDVFSEDDDCLGVKRTVLGGAE